MQYQWVIGAYTGEQAKHVRSLADSGIGYFFQRSAGVGPNYTVMAAFRAPANQLLPEHLELASPQQVDKLEQLWIARHGKRVERRSAHTSATPINSLMHPGVLQGQSEQIPRGDR